ncbi:MAG TPA: ABC transporter substrate-binding protein [Desulfosporosinus sp.]|nr:ABC transporter substrate-binding protein [Desulfosporosinus sp.]
MKRKIRILSVALILLLTVFFTGCGQTQTASTANAPFKLGVIYSTSGASASVGTQEKRSVDLFVEETNAQGGINGHPIEVIFENDDTNSEKAVAAAKKLAYNDQVDAIIGPITSSAIEAVKSVTKEAKVPHLSITGSSPKLTLDNPEWYFRNAISSQFQTKNLVKYSVETLGLKNFAILYDGARTTDQYEGFVKDLNTYNLKPVAAEKFQTGETSFNAQLLNLKKANPDAILVLGMINEGAAAAKQIRDLGIQAKILGVVAFAYSDFIKLGGSATEGTLAVTTFLSTSTQPKTVEFVKKFKEKFGEDPDHGAAHTYDALNLIANSASSGQLSYKDLAADRQKIKDELNKVSNYQGVTSPISYSANDHDGYEDLYLVEVKNGKWEVIK